MAHKKRRSNLEVEAIRLLHEALRAAGEKVRAARKRRGWTQAELGRRAELSQQTISQMERGDGATLSLAAWRRVALVLGLPLKFELGRDAIEPTRDAGHLAMQELVLRLGRVAGYSRSFELATKPADPSGWVDVHLLEPVQRRMLLVECCNVIGDIGAASRSSDRKQAEAEALAVGIGHGEPLSVHTCWVVRATRRNRELVARYPELFATRFPGSSRAWVGALTEGSEPPAQRGLVWCDVNATRLFEWRRMT